MGSSMPPVPPRPDQPGGAVQLERWRTVSPGRMKATTIVGAGLKLWSEHWVRWGLATLLLTGIASVVVGAIDPWAATYGAGYWMGDRPFSTQEPEPLAALIALFAGLFLTPWLYVILSKASLVAALDEAPQTPLVGRTVRGVHSVLWIFLLLLVYALPFLILVGILVATMHDASPDAQEGAIGIVFLVFLAVLLWVGPRLAILLHLFVGEDHRGTKAIGETWRRSRGAWGTALGVIVLNILIAIGITLIPGSIAETAFPLPTVEDAVPRAIIYALVAAVVTPIGFAIGAALYLELSARKSVLDQASLRRSLARFDPG